jgi:hypothetical protein
MGSEGMFSLELSGALRVKPVWAADQVSRRQPAHQPQQGGQRDTRSSLLRQLRAIDWIQHPAGDGDLFAVVQSDNVDTFRKTPQGSNQHY